MAVWFSPPKDSFLNIALFIVVALNLIWFLTLIVFPGLTEAARGTALAFRNKQGCLAGSLLNEDGMRCINPWLKVQEVSLRPKVLHKMINIMDDTGQECIWDIRLVWKIVRPDKLPDQPLSGFVEEQVSHVLATVHRSNQPRTWKSANDHLDRLLLSQDLIDRLAQGGVQIIETMLCSKPPTPSPIGLPTSVSMLMEPHPGSVVSKQ